MAEAQAEQFLESLLATTKNERRRRGLIKLAEVLRERVRRGERLFLPAVVAAESAKNGGPALQTILNKPGEDYRALISTFAAINGGDTARGNVRRGYEVDLATRLAAAITNPQIRAEVALIIAENRSFKRQIDLLRSQISGGMIIKLGSHDAAAGANGLHFTDVEIAAVRQFISPDNLQQNGWCISAERRLNASSGREVARVGFLSALEKIGNSTP